MTTESPELILLHWQDFVDRYLAAVWNAREPFGHNDSRVQIVSFDNTVTRDWIGVDSFAYHSMSITIGAAQLELALRPLPNTILRD